MTTTAPSRDTTADHARLAQATGPEIWQTGWTALVADLLLDPPRRVHRMIFYDETTTPDVSTIATGPAG